MEIEELEAPRSFKRRNDHGRENAPCSFVFFFFFFNNCAKGEANVVTKSNRIRKIRIVK